MYLLAINLIYIIIDQVTNFDNKVAQIIQKVEPLLSEDIRQSIKDFSMR